MIAFIDPHKDQHGIEPICKQLPIAVSAYYDHKGRESDPDRASNRSIRERHLKPEIQRVWEENLQVYGARKDWRQLKRGGHSQPKTRPPGRHWRMLNTPRWNELNGLITDSFLIFFVSTSYV